MQDDREQRIRDRAYSIWEEQGRPQGEDMRHWLQAWQEISESDIPHETEAKPDDAAPVTTTRNPPVSNPPVGNGSTPPKGARKKKS